MNVDFIALQVTMLDYEYMSKLRPQEFIGQAWNKKGKEINAPGIIATIDLFNKISKWLSTSILSEESMEGRQMAITNLIQVGMVHTIALSFLYSPLSLHPSTPPP